MSAEELQLIESQGVIDLSEYQLTGDNATIERKCQFLLAYRDEGVVYRAAVKAGIHRATVYKWMEADAEFVRAFDDCHEDTYDQLEASGFKKALAGDSLLTMFYLKAHRLKFRDKVAIDVTTVQSDIDALVDSLRTKQLTPNVDSTKREAPDDNEA